MSPEQAEGLAVGPASDISSLGAVLAFAATGQGPFGTGSTPALVYRVVHSAPQLDEVPAEVRPLVEQCLAKDPARRPSARGLLAGAAFPAAGWLPEPVTRTFSLDPAQMSGLGVTRTSGLGVTRTSGLGVTRTSRLGVTRTSRLASPDLPPLGSALGSAAALGSPAVATVGLVGLTAAGDGTSGAAAGGRWPRRRSWPG